MVIVAFLIPAVLFVAALLHLVDNRVLAGACRAAALVAALALAWMLQGHDAQPVLLHNWIDVDGLRIDAVANLSWPVPWLLLLVALWDVTCYLLDSRARRVAAALDLAAAGSAVCLLSSGIWLSLVGCELLLVAAFLWTCASAPAAAARKLLMHTRICSAALVGVVVFSDTAGAAWLALLAAAVLAGAWPFHSWLEDLGPGAAATGIRLLAAAAGVQILWRFAEPLPQAAVVMLLASVVVSTVGALAAQGLFRSHMLLVAAQGALLLALAATTPMATLLLLAVLGSSQVVYAASLAHVTAALPNLALRVCDLGGLAAALPWTRWLSLAAVLVAALSPSALWAAALLGDRGWLEAGPVGAAVVGLVMALPLLPLMRLALAPFTGPVIHTTSSVTSEPVVATRTIGVLLLLAAVVPAGLAASTRLPAATPAAAIGVAAMLLMVAVGYLLWRGGPRPVNQIEPPMRSIAAGGFGVPALMLAAGGVVQATGRWMWTAVDGVLFSGVPVIANLGVRAIGWVLAWLHDGWSGWALATAAGTAVILLWILYGPVAVR